MNRSLALLLAVALLPGAAPAADNRALAEQARAVLAAHCTACHGPGGSGKGGFSFLLDRDRLVSRKLVRPGDVKESRLFQRIADDEMPPEDRKQPTSAEKAALQKWIEAGAPAWQPAKPPTLVTMATQLKMVRDDLQGLDSRQRRFARYLTLTHLGNLTAEEIQKHRQAVVKLVNALSWHPRITRPVAVDAAETVFRLDLRDYKWSARSWDRLAAAYPYRLGEQSEPAKAVAALAGCEQPVLRADWFAATASRPPFYFDFLDLPATAGSLERQLQVDVEADLRNDTAVRAGFNGSGVARNNRVLERHDAAHGAYWKSYDFSDNTNRQNIFEHPLGPGGVSGFQHAGGEIIFHLPNGLHGYMLVDSTGRRLDKAPGEIVSDPKRPDKLVETGVSCFSCHAKGLLPKDDQVRAHVKKNAAAFPVADRGAILALYAPAARFKALQDEDNERFTKAMARAGVPLTDPEPIEVVTLRFEAVVDLPAAAAEVGLSADDFATRLRKSRDLTRALGALLSSGGTLQRQAWEEAFPDLVKAFDLDKGAAPATANAAPLTPFTGHDGSVRALAFSPDSRFVATGGADRTVRLWEAATGKELRRYEGHTDEVYAVAVSANGKRIISAGRDRAVRIWDGESNKLLHRLVGHTDVVRSVAIAANGKWALSGGDDRAVIYWDLESGKELWSWSIKGAPVMAVALSADGKMVLAGGRDGTIRGWNGRDGEPLGKHQINRGGAVYAVAISPNGKWALSGGNDKVVRLWDVKSGAELKHFTGHENAVIRVAFTPDGRRVLSGSSRYQTADRVLRVWDAATGAEQTDKGIDPAEGVEAVAIAPDGRAVLMSHPSGIRLWRIGEVKEPRTK